MHTFLVHCCIKPWVLWWLMRIWLLLIKSEYKSRIAFSSGERRLCLSPKLKKMKIGYKIGPAIYFPFHLTTSSLHMQLTQERKRMRNKLKSASVWPSHLLSLLCGKQHGERSIGTSTAKAGTISTGRRLITLPRGLLTLLLFSNLRFPSGDFRCSYSWGAKSHKMHLNASRRSSDGGARVLEDWRAESSWVLDKEDQQLSGPEEKSNGCVSRRLLVSPLSSRGVGICQPPTLWLRSSVRQEVGTIAIETGASLEKRRGSQRGIRSKWADTKVESVW